MYFKFKIFSSIAVLTAKIQKKLCFTFFSDLYYNLKISSKIISQFKNQLEGTNIIEFFKIKRL